MLAAAISAVRRFFRSDDAETLEAREKRLAEQRELGENAYIRIREATTRNQFHNPLTCAIGIGTVGPLQVYTFPFNGNGDMYTVAVFMSGPSGWTGAIEYNTFFVLQLDISVGRNHVSLQTKRNGPLVEGTIDQVGEIIARACTHTRTYNRTAS
ncbi:hypothetical protein K2X96_01200 [Patescibacteria group bacterium]|nr:hypothetical protein [Patescibacteria group bacterium]